MNGFHQVKRNSEDRLVVAVEEDGRRRSIDGVEPGKHSKFAAHIMRRFDFAAEGRAPQHHFSCAEGYQVCQVGMTAGKLLETERATFLWKMASQKGLEFGQVKLFSWSNLCRVVQRIGHQRIPIINPAFPLSVIPQSVSGNVKFARIRPRSANQLSVAQGATRLRSGPG